MAGVNGRVAADAGGVEGAGELGGGSGNARHCGDGCLDRRTGHVEDGRREGEGKGRGLIYREGLEDRMSGR